MDAPPTSVSFDAKRDFELGCHALTMASDAQDRNYNRSFCKLDGNGLKKPSLNRTQYKQSDLHTYMQTLKAEEQGPEFWATIGKRSRDDKFVEDCREAKFVADSFGREQYDASISNPKGKHAAPFTRNADKAKWVAKSGFDSTFGKRSADDAMTMLRKQAMDMRRHEHEMEVQEGVQRSRSAGSFGQEPKDPKKVLRKKEFQDLAAQLLGPPKDRFAVTFFNGRKMDAADQDAKNYKDLGGEWRQTQAHPNRGMTRHNLMPREREFQARFGKRTTRDARTMQFSNAMEEARFEKEVQEKGQLPLYPFGDPSSDSQGLPMVDRKSNRFQLSNKKPLQQSNQMKSSASRSTVTQSSQSALKGRRTVQTNQNVRNRVHCEESNFLSAEVSVATTSFDVVPPGSAVEMAASLRGSSSRRPKPNGNHSSSVVDEMGSFMKHLNE